MTREEAIKIVKEFINGTCLHLVDQEALETLIPELAKSEDERIKKIITDSVFYQYGAGVEYKDVLDYLDKLEKQKEQKVDIDKEKLIRHCIGLILTDATDERFKDYGLTLKECLTWLGEQKEQKPLHWRRIEDATTQRTDDGCCITSEKMLVKGWINDEDYRIVDEGTMVNRDILCIPVRELNAEQKERKPIAESKRLANEVIEYLTKCGYSPVLKDDSKKEHFHIDIPRHEDDFWLSEEYKYCRSVLGEYYMEGDYGGDTYTLYIWREKKEQKPAESISQLTVQGKGVYKICPRCKERMVRDDSIVYTSMPPQYRYECPKCGEMEFDTVMYDNPEMEEQKPAEWSEEDEKMLKSIDLSLDCYEESKRQFPALVMQISRKREWLQSLPERFNLQPKQEWSEEDRHAIENCEYAIKETFKDEQNPHRIGTLDWLKSLHPSWKPSEEQMKTLKNSAYGTYQNGDGPALRELYQQLKKQ